jgi:intracellular septation protein A
VRKRNFFRVVFHKTFHFTEEGWHNLTRNAALFFLATALANEAVRFGFTDAHIIALNCVFTGIDIWLQDIHRHARDGRVLPVWSGFCRSTGRLTP